MKDCHSKMAQQPGRRMMASHRVFGQTCRPAQSAIGVFFVALLMGVTDLSHADPQATRVDAVVPALISAFGRADIVALGEHHGSKFCADLELALIRDPSFPKKARFILVEWANSRYQPILDRYIMGGEVPMQELRQVWQNTTQVAPVFPAHREFLTAIRQVNQKLQRTERVRVLAGDPPIDWSHIHSQSEYLVFGAHRDDSAFAVLVTALSRGERGLMIYGSAHLRPTGGIARLFESRYPGRMFVYVPPAQPGDVIMQPDQTDTPGPAEMERRRKIIFGHGN